jgi:hypothetical protein
MGFMPRANLIQNLGFLDCFFSRFGAAAERFESMQSPACGAKPRLCARDFLALMVWHVISGSGYLSAHVRELFGMEIKDSSLSERRRRIGIEPFAWLMKHALRPLADRRVHKSCHYKGLLLCGIDGTKWSVGNTPQILSKMSKAASRRLKSAFAKVEMCALVELGLHNPIAAVTGLKGEGEWTLALRLLEALPEKALLIVDRLYGCGKYLAELAEICRSRRGELLVKARKSNKSEIIRLLGDGSAMVEIRLPRRKGEKGVRKMQIREIRGRVRKPGAAKWSEVRLWTTLFDENLHPAEELMALYAGRWEQEIFYKELKIEMRGGELLRSHTPETAVQEIAALLMACSLMAGVRAEVARSGKLEPLRISFVKTLGRVRSLWMVLCAAEGLIDEESARQLVGRIMEQILAEATPPRRNRSCPRKVRQPVSSWPRLLKNQSNEGDYEVDVVNMSSIP